MALLIDHVLVEMYVEHDVPCDRLVSNPEKLKVFTEEYWEKTGEYVDEATLAHRLLNLRRKGQANGGLPRLRRGYNGRGEWRA